jgi:mRNA-degrading endonuclease RelE of RelBE toxin-antitoxin system
LNKGPYEIRFTREAVKDVNKLTPKQQNKLKEILINGVAINPYSGKKLIGDLEGFYSMRLSYADRIVYSIDEKKRIVTVHRTRTHYGE